MFVLCGDGIIVQKLMSKLIKMYTLNMCNSAYKVCLNKALKRVIKKIKQSKEIESYGCIWVECLLCRVIKVTLSD